MLILSRIEEVIGLEFDTAGTCARFSTIHAAVRPLDRRALGTDNSVGRQPRAVIDRNETNSMNRRRLIFVLYVAALLFATHLPLRREMRPELGLWYHAVLDSIDRLVSLPLPGRLGRFDKVAHLSSYALLTLLAFRAAETDIAQSGRMPMRSWRVHPIAIVLMLLAFGVVDETTQPFFGRTLDWYDYAANVVGITLVTTYLMWRTSGARAGRASWRRPAPVEST